MTAVPRVAIVGTDLAALRPEAGALERSVLRWSAGLDAQGFETVCLDANDPAGLPLAALGRFRPDVVVLNNRPLWAEALDVPVLHVLHNYPDAWGTASEDEQRIAAVLSRGTVSAVSPALAREIGARFALANSVLEVRVGVEACFFAQPWAGTGGPVVFPNRLLEKKGVRLFLEIAPLLAGRGRRCIMFRHLAPWVEPTAEQQGLLELIEATDSVELLSPPPTRAEMAECYGAAGVVVCPSTRPEGLGLVALEAQAAGAPLVTSGLGGLADGTFPPNEMVTGAEPVAWCSAIERAAARAPSSIPRQMTEELYGNGAPEASLVAAVQTALG